MIIRKGYKFRLNTGPADEALCRPYCGCQLFIWNKALALSKERLTNAQSCLSYNKLTDMLPAWKKKHLFLADVPPQTLQHTLKDSSQAINEALDKDNPKRFPVFKKKHKSKDSFRYPQGFAVKHKQVFLPKIGWVSFRKSRDIKGKPENATIARELDHCVL